MQLPQQLPPCVQFPLLQQLPPPRRRRPVPVPGSLPLLVAFAAVVLPLSLLPLAMGAVVLSSVSPVAGA
eukprot:gene42106-46755_t